MKRLRARWLGRVPYREAHDLQRALFNQDASDYFLALEHPHVYTLGTQASRDHVLVDPATVGAELVDTDRGGDVTYHGPGQLLGYPIVTLPVWRDGMRDLVAYVRSIEGVLIEALGDCGVTAGRLRGYTGVWIGEEKIAAIGLKVTRGRTMHGFALNVDTDLSMFGHIVPCGIADKPVTSMRRVLGEPPEMRSVVDAVIARFAECFGYDEVERQDVAWRERPADLSPFTLRALAGLADGQDPGEAMSAPVVGPSLSLSAGSAGPVGPVSGELGVRPDPAPPGSRPGLAVDGRPALLRGDDRTRPARAVPAGRPVRLLGRLAAAGVATATVDASLARPPWMKVRARVGEEHRALEGLLRALSLNTVCEEAGCPNIYECWAERTATFMILGKRCTRACGFCLVDTRRPEALDLGEPARVAEAVARMGLAHAVVTSVARDDVPDGGAAIFAATIAAVRHRSPGTRVEVLIPDCKGNPASLQTIFDARPDVLNHNLETVARLQRAARPSAAYSRSLFVLARAKVACLTTKSGMILGMGETAAEVRGAIADLRAVGVDILTLGQYLRPTPMHLPVDRWWHPDEFAELRVEALGLGFAAVEAGPLVRSSYHARRAVEAVQAGS